MVGVKKEEEGSPDVFACPPSGPKLILTPRRRARRDWNILHHGIPGCARRRCLDARPRLRSRETRWRPSIDGCRQRSSRPSISSGPFKTELLFEFEGWPPWLTDFHDSLPLTRHGYHCPKPSSSPVTKGDAKRTLFPSDGATLLDHSPSRQRTTSPLPPSRGPSPGGPTDDSPARER